jgi:hypothetical protein
MRFTLLAALTLLTTIALLLVAGNASAQNWQQVPGKARDIGVGANGAVWAVGDIAGPGGFAVFRREGAAWAPKAGHGERIAVDPLGDAWVVTNTQAILRWDSALKKFVTVPGAARDIGIGSNGVIWIVGNVADGGGYGLLRSTDRGATWTKMPGSAVRVAVDHRGFAWVVNKGNAIFQWNGTAFVPVAGTASDIGVGADGSVWITGTDGSISRRQNATWEKKAGGASQVSAGPGGLVWVVNSSNEVYWGKELPRINVRHFITRGGEHEARILKALRYGTYGNAVWMGGKAPLAATLPVLDQGFADLAIQATEAFFVGNDRVTPAEAIAKIASDTDTRRTISTFQGLILIERARGTGRDAQTVALRQWTTDLYRSLRIQTAKALLDEYSRWKRDPCTYERLPAARCSGYTATISAPRPPENLIATNAMAGVLASKADEVALALSVGLTAATMGASAAALIPALGAAATSAAGVATTTSLFGVFTATSAGVASGATVGASAGAIGGVAWGGIVAAPVAAAVLVVVVGTMEGIAVAEAARVEPLLKLRLGAAMTETIVIQNALNEQSARDLFLMGFAGSAANGYAVPQNTVDGEVRFFCQAGYVSRFKLAYKLNGAAQASTTKDLSVGFGETFAIPARATDIVASGEWFDGGRWKPLFSRNLARPTYIGFTSYGTVFDAKVKDEYPETGNVVSKPRELTVTHGGGYQARISMTYTLNGQQKSFSLPSAQLGWRSVFQFPEGSTNVRFVAHTHTGLVWEPFKQIIDRSWPLAPNECIKLFGTTLDPKTSADCR